MNLFDLTGKVGVVSGAASGMGRAISLAWAGYGARLLLLDLNEEGLQRTSDEIRSAGGESISMKCNVSNPDAIYDAFKVIDDEFQRIDLLANVAGEGILQSPETISLDQVEQVWRNLVYGRFCMCQEAGRRMLAQGGGSIINIGSLASITALGRGHIAYSMAMGAVAQMTRELSTEWSGRGVRVNAILPAQVMNPGLEQRIEQNPEMLPTWLRGIPAGRLGQPTDIQGLAVFLASDSSQWITGTLIPMDGGNLAVNAGGSVGKKVGAS